MDQGWIKLYRKTLENPVVMKNADHLALWVYLLMKATHKKRKINFDGEFIEMIPGQLVTGRKSVVKVLNLTESKVQRILKTFENEQLIEQRTTPRGRLISILNWGEYQESEHQNEQQVNNKRTTSEQQVNTNKNVRMEEWKNGRNTTLTSEEVDRVILAWNSFAQNKIHKISPNSTRYTHLRKRVEEDGLGEVLRAIQMTSESDFMQGKNKNGWVANFDWLMKPSNFQKTIEGNYQDKSKTKSKPVDMGEEEALRSLGVKF